MASAGSEDGLDVVFLIVFVTIMDKILAYWNPVYRKCIQNSGNAQSVKQVKI